MDVVDRDPRLGEAGEEEVGKGMRPDARESPRPFGPAPAQPHAVTTDEVKAGLTAELGEEIEPGREDQAIDSIFGAVGDHAFWGDPLYPLPLGVDQGDVVPVESRQVFVVEAGPLAEVVVVGLE